MSDDHSSKSDSEGALDLSDLNFGPAWARDPSESKNLKKYKDRGDRDERRGGGGRRDDRRGGGGGGGRDQRGGGGFRGQKGGGGRGRRDDDRRPPRHEVEPPEGVSLKLMPAEESLDLLAKRVIDSGQTYSVFDLAKVLLQSRDRFRATFEWADQKLFRCREDQSIWLTRDEALRHLWRGDWLKKYYDEVKVEGEAPKGSFSAVARCGLSNELLGPPNYHGYQEKLAALHRERFSNMPLDTYKAKVRMEHGEEAVEAWLESMKTVTKWKVAEPREDDPEKKSEEGGEASESPNNETPKEEPGTAVSEDSGAVSEEAPSGEAAAEPEAAQSAPQSAEAESTEAAIEAEDPPAAGTGAAEETPAAGEAPSEEVQDAVDAHADESAELFDDARAVERHFAEHHFEEVFEETDHAWVKGDIRGNLLSPGLLTLLKRSVAEEKRYPAKLMPIVCRQLSGRHVAVFKWNKKLKVGPSRPHAVPKETSLAERPQTIINHLSENSGVALKDFWKAVMPPQVTAEQKHEWLQDFQWLLGEGHIILLADTTVHLAKNGDKQAKRPKPAGEKEFKQTKALVEDPTPPAAPGEAVLAPDESAADPKQAVKVKETSKAKEEPPAAKEDPPAAEEETAPAPETTPDSASGTEEK